MNKRLVTLGVVLLLISTVLVGCGGMSLKLLDKTPPTPIGWEYANVLVKNFQNTEENWTKLKEYGDKFDEGTPQLVIIFYSDESKVIPTNTPQIFSINSSMEGVIGVYNRMDGSSWLSKSPKYTQP